MPLAESGIDKQLPPTASEQTIQALESLRKETQLHTRQTAETGIIGLALTGATEFLHGSAKAGQKTKQLADELAGEIKAGNDQRATELALQASKVILADKNALNIAGQIDMYGSALVKSVGLFMPGKAGYLLAAGTAALDAYKPGQSKSTIENATDIGLDVAKAVGLKASFDFAASRKWGIATTGVGLGITSRISEAALTRTNYLDGKGNYSASAGAEKTFAAATNVSALTSDVASFMIARGALGKLNKTTGGAISENRMLATTLTGGIFGASKGSVDEILRQGQESVFQPGEFAKHVFASTTSNMVGAAIAGKIGRISDKTAEKIEPVRSTEGADRTSLLSGARNNFAGSTAREYQMVGQNLPVAEIMARSKEAFAVTRVREVKASGELGPEQQMLIQHNSKANPISDKSKVAAACDLIASCNPALLPGVLQAKHILASAQESLWLTQTGSRLRFASSIEKLGNQVSPVALGDKSVSSILRDPDARHLLRHKDTHDLGLYADVLKGFKIPGRKIIDGGADSVVIELSNNQILKITPNTWNPQWGSRTFADVEGKLHRFDARIIGKPTLTDGPYGKANFFIQERVITPVSETSMMLFAHRLDRDRKYSFTDRDTSQLGYTDLGGGKKGLVLIDYDAVEESALVLKNMRARRNQS